MLVLIPPGSGSVVVTPPDGGDPVPALMTEAADDLTTEAGDVLITE